MTLFPTSESKIVTYVRHGDLWFFVSTIERSCSAPAASDFRYNETIVWPWDDIKRTRAQNYLKIVDGPKNDLRVHFRIVNALAEKGEAGIIEDCSDDPCNNGKSPYKW